MLDIDYKMSASGTTAEATPQGAQAPLPKHPKLNVTTASTLVSNLLAVETACTTPRTPEILNSVIAMTNPLDDYNYNNASEKCAIGGPRSVNDSTSNSSGSPLGSPANSSTPSIQKTCSQLIKAGLKLSIESKRKMSGSEGSDGICPKRLKKEEPFISEEDDYDDSYMSSQTEGLTPEDEERRRRRRERNKIAATKCRLKKRERTVNLVTESENLETQNIDLKSQIQELQVQKRQLVDMLSHHSSTCVKNNSNNTSSPTTSFSTIQPPYDSPTSYPNSTTPYEPNSPYIRPESANILASSYNTCDIENPPSNYNQPVDPLDIGPTYTNVGTPNPDGNYLRQDDNGFVTNDVFTSKNSNMMLVDSVQPDYTEQMSSFDNQEMNSYQFNGHNVNQQCHNLNSAGSTRRNKFRNTGINNGCLA